jgi:phosphoribosylaminoimidazolecarboxamide formyltransferase/IMP cyclohydrolase
MSEQASTDRVEIRRALVSVYDKTGLEELAQALAAAGVEIVSTGSTAARIAAAGVAVTPVEQLTGFPECLDGRVKTLHPKVHAGLLADRRLPEHVRQLGELGIAPFDLLVSNLYPFRDTVASGATPDECIEQIDIGGPSMVRGAAKNHPSVAVVVQPSAYPQVIEALSAGGFTLEQRRRLAARAFQHTASYDIAVASYLSNVVAPDPSAGGFPEWTGASWERSDVLRYGENPHQKAALYTHWRPGLAQAELLHGKEMSYNNYVDTDAAWRAAHDHDEPCVAVIKHNNPCGIAVGGHGESIADVHLKAHECDPVSAFGGVIATNRTVTKEMAERVAGIFTEVVAAPGFEPEALEILSGVGAEKLPPWRRNLRLLRVPADEHPEPVEFRAISGGLLMQGVDRIDAVVRADDGTTTGGDDAAYWTLVSGEPADDLTLADLRFAWRTIRAVKSNAILLAKDGASVGIGMGQVNRVDSCRLSVARAGADRAKGSVAASDAYFPFPDGLEVLLEAGVRAVVHPGGSVRDKLVIEAAQKAGVTMYHTGVRHFAH